jgi:protein TonB
MELKKNPKVDYQRKYGLFFNIGLVVSLLIVISAFEWKTERKDPKVALSTPISGDEILLIPPTVHTPPKKPVVRQFDVIKIVDDIVDVPNIEIDIDINKEPDISDAFVEVGEPPEEIADEIVSIAETMPSFVGGDAAFYQFVSKNLKYPAQARRLGIEGKVFVHFVVDTDGSLSNVRVVRGIGAGCDVEVERIIGLSPKWNPGKQRGNPVRVRMILPIYFKLQ